MHRWLALIAFLATIPAANWLIGNVGTVCVPGGPCLIPVAPGLMAPSGVLMIGLALVLRDLVQQGLGRWWAAGAIVAGAGLSLVVATPALALASGAAFLLAESADMAVYTPLRDRGRIMLAVLMSGLVGSMIDSAVFLWLAFGSLDFLAGQVVGKMWMSLLAVPIIMAVSRVAATPRGGM
jgi:uncharacterized PurR-regulated membrane protein YhhQ (DUF165 family)